MTQPAIAPGKRSMPVSLIVGVSLVAVALAAAIIAARPGRNAVAPSAAEPLPAVESAAHADRTLVARETQFDFGSISMAAGNVSHRYWLRNEGSDPVLIDRIYTSCMCTTATLVKGMRVIGRYGMPGHGPMPDVNQALAPGEAAYIDAVFDPAAHGPSGLGRTERVITIERAGGAPLALQFTANVTP